MSISSTPYIRIVVAVLKYHSDNPHWCFSLWAFAVVQIGKFYHCKVCKKLPCFARTKDLRVNNDGSPLFLVKRCSLETHCNNQ